MARRPRVYVDGMAVHLIQRGNNRIAIFGEFADYSAFLMMLEEAATRHVVVVHAFVLMTNHYHLLATPVDQQSLSGMMQELGVRYVRHFNRRHGRIGTLFNERYRGKLVGDERYVLTCLRYIEQNPVRAGMVPTPGAYRWSTYRVHALGERSSFVRSHHVYERLGRDPAERQAAYHAICGTALTETELGEQRYWGRSGDGVVSVPTPSPTQRSSPTQR